MTETLAPARNAFSARWAERGLLVVILAAAAALRLHGVGFGLPALNDPDEPLFMLTALDMLRNQSLNPGWFGHPGTTTLYCLALVIAVVAGVGLASGRFADVDAVVAAVFADPAIMFLPARLFIVACGVACVWLTWLLGKRIGGRRLGLAAAALLAVNAVHIEYSQIIRTDMQASVFMLLCALSSVAILRSGRQRDYILAGIWVGLACATKWPAAAMILAPLCAGLCRAREDRANWRRVALVPPVALATLLLASPYLLLDHATLFANLAGEARPTHPGATGGGFASNLGWYMMHPLLGSFGVIGVALTVAGVVLVPLRARAFAVAVLPGALAFLIGICAQALVWERWIVPLLPFAALAAALSLCWIAAAMRPRLGGRGAALAATAVALLIAAPMIHAAWVRAAERADDTRQAASAWIRSHVPPGSSILVEHAAFDLLSGSWRLLFPLGSAGCLDAQRRLDMQFSYAQMEPHRVGRAVVDLGHVDPALLDSCRADYAVLTRYNTYSADALRFPDELARYRELLAGATVAAAFRPIAGLRRGPVVLILRLPRSPRGKVR